MDKNELMKRTKLFALEVIGLHESLPYRGASGVIRNQMLRCGTSVGANYRSACHARSRADFIAKLGIVAEEADEAAYWMELLVESGLCTKPVVHKLMAEANALASIFVASINTARGAREQITNPKSQIANLDLEQQH